MAQLCTLILLKLNDKEVYYYVLHLPFKMVTSMQNPLTLHSEFTSTIGHPFLLNMYSFCALIEHSLRYPTLFGQSCLMKLCLLDPKLILLARSGATPSRSRMGRSVCWPLLKTSTAWMTATSMVNLVAYSIFGARAQIKLLKLSFLFWVAPRRHFSSRFWSESLSNTGFT